MRWDCGKSHNRSLNFMLAPCWRPLTYELTKIALDMRYARVFRRCLARSREEVPVAKRGGGCRNFPASTRADFEMYHVTWLGICQISPQDPSAPKYRSVRLGSQPNFFRNSEKGLPQIFFFFFSTIAGFSAQVCHLSISLGNSWVTKTCDSHT